MAEATKTAPTPSLRALLFSTNATTLRFVRADMAEVLGALAQVGKLESLAQRLRQWEGSLAAVERLLRQEEEKASPSLAQALTGMLETLACTGDEPEVKAAREALVEAGYPDPLDFGEGP